MLDEMDHAGELVAPSSPETRTPSSSKRLQPREAARRTIEEHIESFSVVDDIWVGNPDGSSDVFSRDGELLRREPAE